MPAHVSWPGFPWDSSGPVKSLLPLLLAIRGRLSSLVLEAWRCTSPFCAASLPMESVLASECTANAARVTVN